MKTLATTMVDECRRELTGVGLSIAFGSQLQKTAIEDLAVIAKNLKKDHSMITKQKSKKSLTRFNSMAKRALFWAKSRPKNSIIKKYDITPIISHLTIKK